MSWKSSLKKRYMMKHKQLFCTDGFMELLAEKYCEQQEVTVASSCPLDLKTSLFLLWIIVYLFSRLNCILGGISAKGINLSGCWAILSTPSCHHQKVVSYPKQLLWRQLAQSSHPSICAC